jgi:hypothetical protein
MLLERSRGVGDLRQPGTDLLIKALTGRRQHRLTDTPLEQQHTQVLLKQFDVPADGTVTDMQLLGRQAETLMASSNGEGANSIKRR